jgi:hypothetical protein
MIVCYPLSAVLIRRAMASTQETALQVYKRLQRVAVPGMEERPRPVTNNTQQVVKKKK